VLPEAHEQEERWTTQKRGKPVEDEMRMMGLRNQMRKGDEREPKTLLLPGGQTLPCKFVKWGVRLGELGVQWKTKRCIGCT